MKKTNKYGSLIVLALFASCAASAGVQIVTVQDGDIKPAGVFMSATNRAAALWDTSGSQWIDGTGGVWRVTQGVTGWTFYVPISAVTISAPDLSFPLPDPYYYTLVSGDWTVYVESAEGGSYDVQIISGSGDYYSSQVVPLASVLEIASTHELPNALMTPIMGGAVTSLWDGVFFASGAAALTNGLVTASITNGLGGGSSIDPSITNGLATLSALSDATQSLASVSYVTTATGGLVRASITNGLASIASLASATQSLVSASALESALSSKLDASGGTAQSLSISGTATLLNTQPTNIVLRLYLSNDTLIAEQIIQ